MSPIQLSFCILGALVLTGCVTANKSSPPRTATEQLLISAAADRAAKELVRQIASSRRVFVDASNIEGLDSKYAIAAVRSELAKSGAQLVPDRSMANTVVEIRTGALSIDEREVLVGIPELNIPVPLSGAFTLPKIALFSKDTRQGVAKFGAVSYDIDAGSTSKFSRQSFGFSNKTKWTALLFIHWSRQDILPEKPK